MPLYKITNQAQVRRGLLKTVYKQLHTLGKELRTNRMEV